MSEPKSTNDLAAVVSFEDSLKKLNSCLKALVTWVPQIIVVMPENQENEKQIANEFNVSVFTHRAPTTLKRWEYGLNHINSRWALLIRSNEVVTGQLRRAIGGKIKTNSDYCCEYLLPSTMVFLKKRLKYPLDWYDSQPSRLSYISKSNDNTSSIKIKYALSEGELIRYNETTLSECSETVAKKAEERAYGLAQNITSINPRFLFIRGIISSIKIFFLTYFLKKGFKEGFEGISFAVCDAHAELLGYLRYHEIYVRDRKILREDLSFLEKILVIKLRDIGDNILCTPLINNLKKHLPNVSISVLTWTYSMPIFEKNPHIDHLFDLPKDPSSLDYNKLSNELNSKKFDLVMSTHSGGLASKLLSKIKSPNKINNFYRGRNKLYNIFTDESDYYRSAIERDLDCLRSLGVEPVDTRTEIFLSNDETNWARATLISKGLDFSKKIVLVHPTAGVTIREWPIEKFNTLIKNLNKKENIQPIVICTDFEYSRVKILLDEIPSLVIFNKITVRQMMAIIHECDLVIDNDSSPSHMATAFGIPTIVLFSQAIREIFRPYQEKEDQHFVFYNDVDCRECELTNCDDRICLYFSPDEVYAQALKMLSPEKK